MESHLLADPRLVFDAAAPRRIVSLVPSTTASLFDLHLGQAVVGVTDYCTYPADKVANLPRVGGPKNPRVEDIIALRPDLVIANREENGRAAVEALASAGVDVWLTAPASVQKAVDDLWTMANLFRSDLAMQQVDMLERAVEWAALAGAGQPAMRYFCPIWEDCLGSRQSDSPDGSQEGTRWWMTFNEQTYPSDVLRIFNGVNVFAGRQRRYPLLADLGGAKAEDPGERDTRYPRVTLEEIALAQPELILLPSEPYAYGEKDCAVFRQIFAGTPAGQTGRIYAVNGTLITWHGTRLARALEELQAVFSG